MLLEFYSGLILFCGLKDRLNQYLQHKKLNLTYCVKSISGPEAYIRGPTEGGNMAHHEVISRSGNAFLLNIRESVLLLGSMSEMHFFTDRYFFYSQ